MADLSYINPFGKYFLRGQNEKSLQRQKQFLDNAQGVSENIRNTLFADWWLDRVMKLMQIPMYLLDV